MPNSRFYKQNNAMAITDVLKKADIDASCESDLLVNGVADMGSAVTGDVIFYDNPKLRRQLQSSKASFCITKPNLLGNMPSGMVGIAVDDPRKAFSNIAQLLYPDEPHSEFHAERIHSSAQIDTTAKVAPTAVIGANVHIGKNVVVGQYSVIQDGAEIAENTRIGNNTTVGHGVQIGQSSNIGDGCSIAYTIAGKEFSAQSGTKIGMTGYGYQKTDLGYERTPQLGCVIIGDKVSIDANCVIEKGALTDTKIGDGTKIGSQVMIGHNVEIGENCLILAQAGIAGSTTLGNDVIVAPQVGIKDHVTIGDGAKIAPQSGVACDIPAGAVVEGTPAVPFNVRARLATLHTAFRENGRE